MEELDKKTVKKGKKKGEKKLAITLTKIVTFIFLFILQTLFITIIYTTGAGIYLYAKALYEIIKLLAIIYLLSRHDSAAYKISWILFITFMPVIGIIAFLLWGNSKLRKKKVLQIRQIKEKTDHLLEKEDICENIIDERKKNQIRYIENMTDYPACYNHEIQYFNMGETFFESLKRDLNKATKYILIEFYIVSKGKLASEVFEILKRKAKEGVEVKMVVDSLGTLLTFPKKLRDELEEAGIEIFVYNKISVIFSGYMNYRDHRKIIAIDGIVAYTGGVNLADEYANIIERYGYWKDVGVRIKGKAAWNFAVMVLRALEEEGDENISYEAYKDIREKLLVQEKIKNTQGFVIPFADGPENRKNPTENTYIQTIQYAKKYVYITTPYFVASESLLNAILNSARSGVDVRIILPYIPDKKLVSIVTKSYYEVLLAAGVKVYEFKPGFIHSKTIVADDETAIVGTANLDYRSLNLNFECVSLMYQTGEELKIKEDFLNMVNGFCVEVHLEDWKKRPLLKKVGEAILTAFAPMM